MFWLYLLSLSEKFMVGRDLADRSRDKTAILTRFLEGLLTGFESYFIFWIINRDNLFIHIEKIRLLILELSFPAERNVQFWLV